MYRAPGWPGLRGNNSDGLNPSAVSPSLDLQARGSVSPGCRAGEATPATGVAQGGAHADETGSCHSRGSERARGPHKSPNVESKHKAAGGVQRAALLPPNGRAWHGHAARHAPRFTRLLRLSLDMLSWTHELLLRC
jgi:hypothetical protein